MNDDDDTLTWIAMFVARDDVVKKRRTKTEKKNNFFKCNLMKYHKRIKISFFSYIFFFFAFVFLSNKHDFCSVYIHTNKFECAHSQKKI